MKTRPPITEILITLVQDTLVIHILQSEAKTMSGLKPFRVCH